MADVLTPDLCIIGAGPGGLAAAAEAAALGAEVVLVERNRMGGSDLIGGSVASKALVGAARHADAMRNATLFGITNDEPRIAFRRVQETMEELVEAVGADFAIERFEALGVTVVGEEARFTDRRTLKAGETDIRARRFVLATGSHPVVPAIPGLDTVPYFTTDTLFDNTRKFTHLVVIGGGPSGIELAQAYRRLGSAVTVVEAGLALGRLDPELTGIALRRLREEGVAILERTAVTAIQARPLGIGVVIRDAGGQERVLDASHILVAAGRAPNLDELGLDEAGIRRDGADAERLKLRSNLLTTNPRIYAIGDAAGGEQRAHLAAAQGRLVARNAILGQRVALGPAAMAEVVYADPEIAAIGLSEPAARQRGLKHLAVLRASFADNVRARTERRTEGLVKLLVAPDGRLLGGGVVGPQAGELASLLALAMAGNLTTRHLASLTTPYPSFSQALQQAAAGFERERDSRSWRGHLARIQRLLP